MTDTCPSCGQRMLIRHGVRLPPKAADIFDLIEKSGSRGITRETLAWVFFSDKPARDAKRLVSVHVNRVNDFLCSTDLSVKVRVEMDGRWGPYRVVNAETPQA